MGKYQFRQFAAIRIYMFPAKYSPDGKEIAYKDNSTGQFNLWTLPSGGGFPRQLTMFEDNTVRVMSWSPDGKRIAFTADQNSDEMHQIYLIDAEGGWPEQITDLPKVQHNLPTEAWSPDGRFLAYAANDENPANMDVIIRDLETGEVRKPIAEEGLYEPAFWSPDGRWLLNVKAYSNTNLDLLLVNVNSGEVINATEHEGEIIFFPGPFTPDSSGFYFTTNQGREYTGLARFDITARTWEWVETPDHDVEGVLMSKNGEVIVWMENIDGASKLFGRNLKTGALLAMPDIPLGQIDSFDLSPDGTRIVMNLARPTEAVNLYEVEIKSGKLIQLGQSMLGGVNPSEMVEPELIHFATFDGREVPAWLYRPKNGQGRVPVVLSIHGGPEAQERPRYMYNGLYQYLLSEGFAILAPNIRGSSGYGITYQKLIHRDWGGAELKDIEAAAQYLCNQSWVDTNRIAVFGGSFGGFATLSAVTRLPEYWAVGVDIVGPANLITFVDSVPPFWKRFMTDWVGDAVEDREMLIERSPITYVDNIRCPMLVIQGANDPRVVQAESDQMVERMRAKGLEVEYYVDPEEGHGAARRKNAVRWMQMVSDFLDNHLMDEPSPN